MHEVYARGSCPHRVWEDVWGTHGAPDLSPLYPNKKKLRKCFSFQDKCFKCGSVH